MEVSPVNKVYKKAKNYRSVAGQSKQTIKKLHQKAKRVKEMLLPRQQSSSRLADTSMTSMTSISTLGRTPPPSVLTAAAYEGPAACHNNSDTPSYESTGMRSKRFGGLQSPDYYSPYQLITPDSGVDERCRRVPRVCKDAAKRKISVMLSPRRPLCDVQVQVTPDRVKINRQMDDLATLARKILGKHGMAQNRTPKRLQGATTSTPLRRR